MDIFSLNEKVFNNVLVELKLVFVEVGVIFLPEEEIKKHLQHFSVVFSLLDNVLGFKKDEEKGFKIKREEKANYEIILIVNKKNLLILQKGFIEGLLN